VILAVAVVVLVEVVLHALPDQALLGYGRGLSAYYDVRHTVEQLGAADVVVLGTSRGRESVVQPLLREVVGAQVGHPITTASFASPGSQADEMLQIMHLTLESPRKPGLVLYFLSPSMFQAASSDRSRLEVLGQSTDRFAGRPGQVLTRELDQLTRAWRRWLDAHYLTFRHRHRFRYLLVSAFRGRQATSAVHGEMTMWQLYDARRSLETHPVPRARIRRYVERTLDPDGVYRPVPRQVTALEETVRLCREHGVPIAVLHAPLSPDLLAETPAQLEQTYQEIARNAAAVAHQQPLTMDDLGVRLTRADFREQSHVNRSGAEKITRALARELVTPTLAGERQPTSPAP
jgi:hypothetical protein